MAGRSLGLWASELSSNNWPKAHSTQLAFA
jgi:hypothetical protein